MSLDLEEEHPPIAEPEIDHANLPAVRAAPRGAAPHGPNGMRPLPANPEAEQQLLGCCLVDEGDTLSRAMLAGVTAESFIVPSHSTLFRALAEMRRSQKPIAVDVLASELLGRKELESVGGFPGLMRISGGTATTAQSGYFIEQVHRFAARRRIIRAAVAATESAYENDDVDELARSASEAIRTAPGGEPTSSVPLSRFTVPRDDDRTVLLGRRYLNRGDGMVFSGPSGMGKSSLTLQAATCWALGRDFFGIRPNGKLKSVIIQAEDSDGDVAEVWVSMKNALRLTPEEVALIDVNVQVVTERVRRGAGFIDECRRLVARHQPDLLWVNPLQSYMDGDVTDSQDLGTFLRGGLNSLNEPATCGIVIIHHTTKPPQERKDRAWHEVQYDMSGGAEIINWARAIVSLRPTDTTGLFNLVLAKRGSRAGVVKKVAQGAGFRDEPVTTIPVKHSEETIEIPELDKRMRSVVWESRDPDPEEKEGASRRVAEIPFAKYANIFPADPVRALSAHAALRQAGEWGPIKKESMFQLIDDAMETGQLLRVIVEGQPRYHRPQP